MYVDRGNDVAALIKAFKEVKDSTKPVVVHINTLKGKGYALQKNARSSGITAVRSI